MHITYLRICGLRGRLAHYDSLRAAAKRRLLACTLAAAREEGALRPLLRITPAEGCSRVPATANKFVHILWKNLICDNVAAARFCARPRGRGSCRCETYTYRFREGDTPAGCRYAGARCAPLRDGAPRSVAQAILARRGRRALRGGIRFAYPDTVNGRQTEGVTYFCARSAP